jgi:phage gpG-like protein
MPFNIEIKISPQTYRFLTAFPKLIRQGLVKGVRKSMALVEREAKDSFGKPGDHLKVITGYLRSSINTATFERGNSVIGEIGSDVIYSRIHEFGGYAGPGRKIYIHDRPYAYPAIENNLDKIYDILVNSIIGEAEK